MNERILRYRGKTAALSTLTIVMTIQSYEGVENIGEQSIIKSISKCLIHHQCRQQCEAGSMTHWIVQDYLEQERGKEREKNRKRNITNYTLHLS
jgi:hypothetical protein